MLGHIINAFSLLNWRVEDFFDGFRNIHDSGLEFLSLKNLGLCRARSSFQVRHLSIPVTYHEFLVFNFTLTQPAL